MTHKANPRKPGARAARLSGLFPQWLIVPVRNLVEGGYETELGLIKQRLPTGNGLVLDVGVGTGETVPLFAQGNLIGLEIDAYPITIASARGNGRFVRGDAVALPFRDNVFSAVMLCKTGHHLDAHQLAAAAAESYRVLAPGGRLIFLDPVPASRKTTLFHRLIAAVELGRYHREFADSAAFFHAFQLHGVEHFRKRGFDFYIALFLKSNND